jgi:hypothetical protein
VSFFRCCLVAFVFLALPAAAQVESPPRNAAIAQIETLGAIAQTDGWCVATNGTANLDLRASAPARITAAIVGAVRFVSVRFIGGAASTRACHRIGGVLQAAACDALDVDAAGVLTDGQAATYAVARNFSAASATLPAINAQANAGTDGAVCVAIGW